MKQRIDGKPHGDPRFLPLPRQAVVLLCKLHLITGHGMLVFPGKRTSERPISGRLCVQRFWPWGTGRPCRWFMASATARATLAEVVEIDPLMKQAELTHAAMEPMGRSFKLPRCL